jgi:hypothetical protein
MREKSWKPGLFVANRQARRLLYMKFNPLQTWIPISLLTFSALLLPFHSQAATSSLPLTLGGLVGATIGNSTSQFTFGAEGQYELAPPFGVGVSLTYYNAGSGISGVSYSSSFTTLTAQGLYYLTDLLSGLHAGAQVGAGFTSTNIPGATGTTDFIFGPMAGYDHPIAAQLTFGGEGTLYFSTRSGTSPIFQILAAIKYSL